MLIRKRPQKKHDDPEKYSPAVHHVHDNLHLNHKVTGFHIICTNNQSDSRDTMVSISGAMRAHCRDQLIGWHPIAPGQGLLNTHINEMCGILRLKLREGNI